MTGEGPGASVAPRPVSRGMALAVLLLVALATRGWDFGNPIIHVDEQYYLLVGDRMLHGALPYVDLWDRKPVGLFAIFALARLLPGDGVLAYQLVAAGFAVATAALVVHCARKLGATPVAALAAGAAYLIWLPLLSGRGGQSPVFYNLFVAGAAALTLRLPDLAKRGSVASILWNGAAACALSGLAIQTKYTPVVEGAFFGLAHLYYLRRTSGSWRVLGGSMLVWMALGILPTALVALDYWRRGPAVFDAFWFANFASVTMRRGYPAAKIAARLAGTTAQFLPFIACILDEARRRPWPEAKILAFGWLGAALVAYAMIGAFFDHYALPLVAPCAIVAALTFNRRRLAMVATLAIGLAIFTGKLATRENDAAGARTVARILAANSGSECPYVFAGDSILYHLARTCIPTAYAFPSTLAYEPERGATGIDEAGEVRRILAHRPPLLVTLAEPLAPWNQASLSVMQAALRADYHLVYTAPRHEGRAMLVYLRNDRHYVHRSRALQPVRSRIATNGATQH